MVATKSNVSRVEKKPPLSSFLGLKETKILKDADKNEGKTVHDVHGGMSPWPLAKVMRDGRQKLSFFAVSPPHHQEIGITSVLPQVLKLRSYEFFDVSCSFTSGLYAKGAYS